MPIRTLIVIALIACAAAGCGRRGGLEDPRSLETAPDTPGDPTAFGGFLPTAGDIEAARAPAPQRGFFLDPLL